MFRSAKMVLHCCSDCCICWGIDTRLGGIAPVIVPPRCILLLLEPFYTYRWICTEVCNYGNIHPCVPTNGFSTLADQCFQMHAALLPRVQFASKLCLNICCSEGTLRPRECDIAGSVMSDVTPRCAEAHGCQMCPATQQIRMGLDNGLILIVIMFSQIRLVCEHYRLYFSIFG